MCVLNGLWNCVWIDYLNCILMHLVYGNVVLGPRKKKSEWFGLILCCIEQIFLVTKLYGMCYFVGFAWHGNLRIDKRYQGLKIKMMCI